MKKFKGLLIFLLIVCALTLIKIYILPDEKSSKPTSGPGNKKPPVVVDVILVGKKKSSSSISLGGTLLAHESVNLSSEIPGIIAKLNITEGSIADEGMVLMQLRDNDVRAQLQKLKSQLEILKNKQKRLASLEELKAVSIEEQEINALSIKSLEAEISYTEEQLNKTLLKAPFKGRLGLRQVSVGEYVTPGKTIASLQQTDPIRIDFSVPEKYRSMVRSGMGLSFTTDGTEGKFTARVIAVEPSIDASTRSILMRAVCENKQGLLVPGAFARIELMLEEETARLFIPTQCLIPVLDGYKVFQIKGGKAYSRMVKTGTRLPDKVQIESGIEAGDTLVVNGLLQLKDSAFVNIKKVL